MMSTHHFLKYFLILLAMTALGIYVMPRGVWNVMNKVTFCASPKQDRVFHKTSLNLPTCSCEEATSTREFVPQEKLDDILKRRAKEYRQHKLRTRTNSDILLALPNCPLQYPFRGFTVAPMKKSVIPGLALQTQKRKLYKVSLSVKNGVLSVDDVLDGEQVDGQDQTELSISSSNLSLLNDLLGRVMYTSTIYHIRTSELVQFSFEEYKVMFPIMIRRPSIPVLFDPGNDINSRVTIATKTFLRYKELKVLINSIRKLYPNIKIIIADDSVQPESVSGNNIEHYIMPPAKGWFAGRNLLVSQVTTKYFLWVDDDFVFLNKTRIESFVEIMEAIPELDVLGGEVSGEQFYFKFEYVEDDEEGGCLRRFIGSYHQPLSRFDGCFIVDGVTNYFLARTDAVRRVGFDPFLKRVGHTEFFIDGLGQLMVATCKNLSIGHQTHQAHDEYDKYRTQEETEGQRKLAHHFFKNYLKCIKY